LKDKWVDLSTIQSDVWVDDVGLSLWDTAEIDLTLYHSGSLIDSFFVDKSEVESFNNLSTSFHKLGKDQWESDILPVSGTYDLLWWEYVANPWVYLYESNSWTDETTRFTGWAYDQTGSSISLSHWSLPNLW
jgi:hypothetical protein